MATGTEPLVNIEESKGANESDVKNLIVFVQMRKRWVILLTNKQKQNRKIGRKRKRGEKEREQFMCLSYQI